MVSLVALDERIEKCEKILAENPQSQIFAALADACRKKGELDKAFRICRQGIRLHAGYGAGHLIMARINFDRKMYDWAETELEEAIKLDGRTRATDILRAEIYVKQGKFDQAKILIDELARSGSDQELFRQLLEEIEQGKLSEKRKRHLADQLIKAQNTEAMIAVYDLPPEPTIKLPPQEILRRLAQFPGVEACFFTDENGMMLDITCPSTLTRSLMRRYRPRFIAIPTKI